MEKLFLTTAITMVMASTAAFAHHPAEDIVDPEIYAMIDENVSDTPHADLTFDDMGSDTTDVSTSTDTDVDNSMGGNFEVAGSSAMEASEDLDVMAEVEPQGSMGSQR